MIQTTNIEEANYIYINESTYPIGLTVGKYYPIYRDYSNPLFEKGEAYVIDDDGKENYGFMMCCKTVFYKAS